MSDSEKDKDLENTAPSDEDIIPQNLNFHPNDETDFLIKDGDLVYIYYDRRRKWIRKVKKDEKFHCDKGFFEFNDIIGQEFGLCLSLKPTGKRIYIFKPILSDIIMEIKRVSQIIYPKDIGLILMYAGIGPGTTIIEAGTGSGSLTSMLANYVRPTGHVYTYDIRPNALKQAKKTIRRLGLEEYVTFDLKDIRSEVEQKEVDVVVLDIPTPWEAISYVKKLLKNSGILVSFSPVMEQVIKTHKALREARYFDIKTFELLERRYQVKENATRPEFDMIGHSGYITFARKFKDIVELETKKTTQTPEEDTTLSNI
ncbi:MAG: tRNA (adenine-N1)-methyltransferase [Promethearchaeota archaeon]